MAALTFDKNELGNLEYSLQREMLATDRRGGYMSTTIVCCNTRKYHGLIVAPIDNTERDYVLLSSLDETIVHGDYCFNLALHRFDGVYEPRGHKYITDFEYTPTPTITYRIGDMVLRKELLWIHKRTQLMVRYTLVECQSDEVTLQLRPFLAFRDRHALSKANMEADGRSYPVASGVKCKLYEGFPWLYMQVSQKEFEFVPAPDWYYGFEYPQELARGYEGHEDLLTPGYFELNLKSGESVVFSASTDELFSADVIKEAYDISISRRTHKIDFLSCLHHSARQFIVRRDDGRTEVEAGYPWYGVIGRQSLFSLPGLTLEQGYTKDCIEVIDKVVSQYKSNTLEQSFHPYYSVDALLWLYRTLQALDKLIGRKEVWERYGDTMISILEMYRVGVGDRVALHDNGLIWAWSGSDGPIFWRDTTVAKDFFKGRCGYQVEVNALWYNAVCYTISMAEEFGNKAFVEEWSHMPLKTKASFLNKFWCPEGWLADSVNYETKNIAIHSSMIVACGLEYKMLSEVEQIDVIRTVNQHLLTPKGLRSLSPLNPVYGKGFVKDTSSGSVWVWPLALYVKACFDISGVNFLPDAKQILSNFEEEIQTYGIGSISEYFDADPPHAPHGAISQAWSVASILEIVDMVNKWEAQVESPKRKVTRKAPAKKPATKRAAIKEETTVTKRKCATKPKTTAAKAEPKAKAVAKPKATAKKSAAKKME
ncbi:MAG: glycogen debranching enzyme N-terminal domain-containing protein [Rikenellaceae bacterium]